MLNNKEIARTLYDIAIYEEMNENKFKSRAYQKAARSIEQTREDIFSIYNNKGGLNALMELPGIGKSIAKDIEELIISSKLQRYEMLKKQYSAVDIRSLVAIEGVGPRKVKTLYENLGITNVEELEKAAIEKRIRSIPGFGEKIEKQILKGIEFLKEKGKKSYHEREEEVFRIEEGGKKRRRFILSIIYPKIEDICNRLRKIENIKKIEMAGSIRRMKDTIGDIDLVAAVARQPEKEVMDYFTLMPEVVHVYAKGKTKSMVRLDNGIDCDLRIVPEKSFGAALLYFTGSKEHDIALRTIAMHKGWRLNEYGLFKVVGEDRKNVNNNISENMIAGKTEEEIYRNLRLYWIPPELRENKGEIKAAAIQEGGEKKRMMKLPSLVQYNELKGDLQIHTNWVDGNNSIMEFVKEAKKIGLQYIIIADHTKALANGLNEEKLKKQKEDIDRINQNIAKEQEEKVEEKGKGEEGKRRKKFTILSGAEVNILKDGSLDINNNILDKLDVVSAGIHSHFNLNRKEQTSRIISAMHNPNVDIISHPTGRMILQQQQQQYAYDIDIEEIIHTAKDTNTILEINASPNRLDLSDEHIRIAVENDDDYCKLSIDSDAHSISDMYLLKFGLAQARRGWAESHNIVNTLPLEKLLNSLK